MPVNIDKTKIITTLRTQLPNLLAIYAFGSQIQGTTDTQSDLDLAVLVAGYADTVALWQLAQTVAAQIDCDVDLVDLRAASTVMQYQIITTGECWWQSDIQTALYECFILNEKMDLDILRADVLADIQREGKIYDR